MAKIELKSGGTQVTGKSRKFGTKKGSTFITNDSEIPGAITSPGGSARGDDFAEDAITSGKVTDFKKTKVDTKRRTKDELENSNFGLAGGPTVMSNANKIERVIPLLESKANNLSANSLNGGGASFTNAGDDTGGFGDEESESFEEVLGFTDKKKKKEGEEPVNVYEQQQLQLLDQMKKTQDRRLRKSISDTQRVFNDRQRQQEEATASGINNLKQVLNLGGSSRYAPVSSQGLLSAAETAGIKALAELDSQEQKLIAEIQDARDTLDYKTMEKKFDFLDKIRQEKSKAVSEFEEQVQETERQSSRDNELAGLISQGVTSPVELLNALNFDEQGNKVGDFTLAEITGTLKGLNELGGTGIGGTGFELDNKAIGKLFGSGFSSTDIQALQSDLNSGASIDEVLEGMDTESQNAVKEAFGVKDTSVLPKSTGKGAQSLTDELFIQTRLFEFVEGMVNRGAVSETDVPRIKSLISEFREAGLGEQEIKDRLSGIPPDVVSPYNGSFSNLTFLNSKDKETAKYNMQTVSRALANKNYLGAMNTVENLGMQEARKLDPDNYIGSGAANFAIKQANELRKAVSDAEEVLGPLDGTWETIKGKLAKSKNPKAAEISAKIAKLTAPMRNQLSGTAVTASETSFLEPLIPSLSDTVDNINIKINELENQTLDRYNSTRSIVSLPNLTSEQVLDPKKRLILYSNDIYLPANGNLDI